MAMPEPNKAAWIDGVKQTLRVGPADMPTPGLNEVVIRNRAVAVNPVDWMVQNDGYFYKRWPNVLGADVAGEIFQVGAGVRADLKPGDRVISHLLNYFTSEPKAGAFQLYSVALADSTTNIPDTISYTDAAVLPLAFNTALIGLVASGSKGFGLPPPQLETQQPDKTLVLWGGSSSVGALVTQVAVASGVNVITTASERNFEFCKECGAAAAFDYHSASVVDDVVHAVQKAGGRFVGVYDAISQPESYPHTLAILGRLGGGKLGSVLSAMFPEVVGPVPENVQICSIVAIDPDMARPFWEEFLPNALSAGTLKCLPRPLVIGKGVEVFEEALKVQKQGVSARKVVVEL